MTTTKSAPAAENGEGADNTEARTNKDTASTAGEQVDEQVEDDSSKTEQTPAAPGEPQAEPAAEEEKKKDITQTYPESLRMMRCDEVEKGFVTFDDHLSELMLEVVRLHCAAPRVTWENPGSGMLVSKISKVHWAWWRLRVKSPRAAGKDPYLPADVVAEMIMQLRHVRVIEWSGMEGSRESSGFLAVYNEELGVYDALDSADKVARLARHLEPHTGARDVAEVMSTLKSESSNVVECDDPNLIPLRNGVLDWTTKELLPHSPDRPFVRMFPVRWVPDAPLPKIAMPGGDEWDPESWISSLTVDGREEDVEQLWEVIAGLFRPSAIGKRVVAPMGPGGNGKGTYADLLRNLSGGPGAAPNLSIADFAREFAGTAIIGSTAVIGDENAVGEYYSDIARFKSAVTWDVMRINRKNRDEIQYRFKGLIYQPLNEFPKFQDKTLSNWRRWLTIPMLNKFATGTVKRPEIKDDFIRRDEVLEYVTWRALSMEFDAVRDTERSLGMLNQARVENDPVLEFWEEFEEKFVWDLLPTSFLHALYVAWQRRDNPSGKPVSQRVLSSRLKEHLETSDSWEFMDNAVRTGNRMDLPETLISEYDLKDWFNPGYTGPDSLRKCLPAVKDKYRGLQRIGTNPATATKAQAGASGTPTGGSAHHYRPEEIDSRLPGATDDS